MEKIKLFFAEIFEELVHKVSWPTWEELMNSTVVVTVSALILALLIWGMNEVSDVGLSTFYKFFQ